MSADPDWLPMETAPKDGTFIHVAASCVHWDGHFVSWSMIAEWADYEDGGWWDARCDNRISPECAMGWRPVPPLPVKPMQAPLA